MTKFSKTPTGIIKPNKKGARHIKKHNIAEMPLEDQKNLEDKKGALIVKTDFVLDYEFNPSIKFEHEGLSLYNWFVNKQKEGLI